MSGNKLFIKFTPITTTSFSSSRLCPMQNSCTRPTLWLSAKPTPMVLLPPAEPVLHGVFLGQDTSLWQQKRYQQGQTLVRTGASSGITCTHSRKGRDLSETAASVGMWCRSSLVQCKWWALGLRLPQTPYALHISGLVLFMLFKRHRAFPWECKVLYFSLRNIWCAWIQVVLLAF